MKHSTRYEPETLLAKYRNILEGISLKEFFRSPKHQKTMEMWCAAHFARAYERNIQPCAILIDDTDIQTDVDFELEIDDITHPFQVTEVMEPGRRRGDEYRNGDPVRSRDDDIESGTALGASWICSALEHKLAKAYANVDKLNMLVYLNFAGRNLKYEVICDRCHEVASMFASAWLLSGNMVCCIHHNTYIPSWKGWMMIDETLADDVNA